jgi:hypothetical protein
MVMRETIVIMGQPPVGRIRADCPPERTLQGMCLNPGRALTLIGAVAADHGHPERQLYGVSPLCRVGLWPAASAILWASRGKTHIIAEAFSNGEL